MKVAVMHNEVPFNAPEDEKDVLIQAQEVSRALAESGMETVTVAFSDNMRESIRRLKQARPDYVFNLVESFRGSSSFAFVGAAVLDFLKIPYTGNSAQALYNTSDKVLTKRILRISDVATPFWLTDNVNLSGKNRVKGPFIIKQCKEHASVGIDDDSVVFDTGRLETEMLNRRMKTGADYFAEIFIDGREFNVSMVENGKGPEVYSPQEVCFENYPKGKIKMISYKAKWIYGSFEHDNIHKRSEFDSSDTPIIEAMKNMALSCWKKLKLGGYARIDFRVDGEGCPWVIDVNANPCLAPDGNFVNSLKCHGLDYRQIIDKITNKFNRRG